MTTHQHLNPPEAEQLDLQAILRPVRAKWWLVLGIVVVVTVAAYLLDSRQTKVYQASTSVYVNPNENPAAQFSLGSQQFQINTTNQLADLAQLLQSPGAAALVAKQIHKPFSPSQISVEASNNADFITITAKASTGPDAAGLANAYANALIDQGRQQVDQELLQLQIQTQDQLSALPASGPGIGAERSSLVTRLRELQNAKTNPDTAEQQVNPATAPGVPISPDPEKIAIFAFFLSLLGAVLLVYVLERVDQRIKDLNGLISLYKLPLLAVIPHVNDPDSQVDGVPRLPAGAIEPTRMLRMSIDLQSLETPIKTLLVTSAMAAEGKSTVARNLALVYREAGVNVVLVDADLRRPSASKTFTPLDMRPGLTGYLLGEAAPAEAIVAARIVLPGDPRRGTTAEEAVMSVLPGGGPAANPPALLASPRMTMTIRELATQYDMVIIDSTPLLPVSDALPLLSVADAIIMVGRTGTTRRDAIKRVRGVLAGIGRTPMGLVANDIPPSNRSYLYGYGPYDMPTAQEANGAGPAKVRSQ
jgi:capsular exopolysaccharide synthesis family protein